MSAESDGGELGALDANMRAFVGRLMTGYESMHRSTVELCETLNADLKEARSSVHRSTELQLKMAEEYENLISQRHKRDLEMQAAANRAEALADIMRDARALGPLIVKRLAGIPITGNDSHGLQDLLASMSFDQVQTVMQTGELKLSEPQRQLLAQTLQSLAASSAPSAATGEKPEGEPVQ